MIKFHEGLTSVSIGLEHQEELEFPDITFCITSGWKEEALSKMGLSIEFMKPQMGSPLENQEIDDIDKIWEISTHNWKEFPVKWITDAGNYRYIYTHYRFKG